MSFKMVVAIRDHSMVQSTGQFAVLMVLATYANNNGDCWCAIENLMKHTRLARSGVKKILRQLENSGQIKPLTNGRGGRGKATRYRIELQAEEVTEQQKGRTEYAVFEEAKNVKSPKKGSTECPVLEDKGSTECPVSKMGKGLLSDQKGLLSDPDISYQRKISECENAHTRARVHARAEETDESRKNVRTSKNVQAEEPQNVQAAKNIQPTQNVQAQENLIPPLPPLSEVSAYCAKLGLPATDAKYLHDLWLSNGFKNNGGAIVDWQAAIRARKARNFLPSLEQVRKQVPKSKSCLHS
jgi:hypothetical protein